MKGMKLFETIRNEDFDGHFIGMSFTRGQWSSERKDRQGSDFLLIDGHSFP